MDEYDLNTALENFWDNLLSQQPDRIQAALDTLDEETRKGVIAHLQRMVTEEGWHPLQRTSAQAALDVASTGETGR
jgi:hypothetical protein